MHRLVALLLTTTSALLVADATFGQAATRQPRVFARGVLTTIEPELQPEETFSRQPMIEITSNKSLDWQPSTLPKTRTRQNMHTDPNYYPMRNHLIEFLVNRSKSFAAEVSAATYDPRHPPVVEPAASPDRAA